MPPKQKIKHLSAEALKSKLYDHLRKSGSMDHVTAQMRGLLVSELFKVSEPIAPDIFPSASDTEKCLLPLQVCNWLVYDHLSRQDYQYTLSTFITEAQLPYPDKFLTAADVLRLLGVSQNTTEFQQISKTYSENNELGYLHSLLLAIIKILFIVSNKDENPSAVNSSSKKIDKGVSACASEIYKPEVTGNLSLNENLSKSKQINQNRSFWSDSNIKSADVSFQEHSSSFKEENERDVQKLRHRLMEELESLYAQERKRKLEVEVIKSELRKEQGKISKEKTMLKEREIDLEKEITNKFEMKMRDAESDFASKLHFKDKEIESLKSKLSEKDEKLVKVETELANEKHSNKFLKEDHDETKRMYTIIQNKYSSVLDENTNLIKKFESMSDYIILKEELAVKSREVTRLQNEMKEIHLKSETERRKFVETVRNMEDNIKLKESELTDVKEDLDNERKAFNNEKSMWNKEKRKLEKELSESKELYKNMLQRTEDQEEEIADLHKSLNALNYKFTNNVLNKAKTDGFSSYRNFHKTFDTVQKSKPEPLFTKRNIFLQQQHSKNIDSENYLSNFRNKFDELKEEEEKILEKFFLTGSTLSVKQSKSSEKYKFLTPGIHKSDNSSTLPKADFLNSHPNHYSWSKSRLNMHSKGSYSLNDVKQMVAHSLSTGRTSDRTFSDYHASLPTSSFNYSSQLPNAYSRLTNTNGPKMHTIYSSVNSSSIVDDSEKLNSQLNQTKQRQNVPFTSQRQNIAESSIGDADSSQQERENRKILKNVHEDNCKTPYGISKSIITPVPGVLSESACNDVNLTPDIHDRALKVIGNIPENSLVQSSQNLVQSSQNLIQSSQNLVQSSQDECVIVPGNTKNGLENIETNILRSSQDTHVETPEATENELGNKEVDSVQSSQTVHEKISTATEKRLESSPPVFVNLDNAWKSRSETSYTGNIVLPEVTLKIKQNSFLQTRAETGDIQNIPSCSFLEDNDIVMNSPDKEVQNVRNNVTKDKSKLPSIPPTIESEIKNKTPESESNISDLKHSNNSVGNRMNTELELELEKETFIKEQDNVKSSEKVGSADSMSELSHLSCGSEAEEQKEDSDGW